MVQKSGEKTTVWMYRTLEKIIGLK